MLPGWLKFRKTFNVARLIKDVGNLYAGILRRSFEPI